MLMARKQLRTKLLLLQGSWLINNARGAIVDVDAVKEACETGQLGGHGHRRQPSGFLMRAQLVKRCLGTADVSSSSHVTSALRPYQVDITAEAA